MSKARSSAELHRGAVAPGVSATPPSETAAMPLPCRPGARRRRPARRCRCAAPRSGRPRRPRRATPRRARSAGRGRSGSRSSSSVEHLPQRRAGSGSCRSCRWPGRPAWPRSRPGCPARRSWSPSATRIASAVRVKPSRRSSSTSTSCVLRRRPCSSGTSRSLARSTKLPASTTVAVQRVVDVHRLVGAALALEQLEELVALELRRAQQLRRVVAIVLDSLFRARVQAAAHA